MQEADRLVEWKRIENRIEKKECKETDRLAKDAEWITLIFNIVMKLVRFEINKVDASSEVTDEEI